MNNILVALLAIFGIGAGIFIGTGNYGGLLGAILPGLFGGLILAIPSIRERSWTAAAIIAGCVLLGSIISVFVPDSNGLKRFCREQSSLYIRVGPYHLGRSADEGPSR